MLIELYKTAMVDRLKKLTSLEYYLWHRHNENWYKKFRIIKCTCQIIVLKNTCWFYLKIFIEKYFVRNVHPLWIIWNE